MQMRNMIWDLVCLLGLFAVVGCTGEGAAITENTIFVGSSYRLELHATSEVCTVERELSEVAELEKKVVKGEIPLYVTSYQTEIVEIKQRFEDGVQRTIWRIDNKYPLTTSNGTPYRSNLDLCCSA